jgi:hypothetical protein
VANGQKNIFDIIQKYPFCSPNRSPTCRNPSKRCLAQLKEQIKTRGRVSFHLSFHISRPCLIHALNALNCTQTGRSTRPKRLCSTAYSVIIHTFRRPPRGMDYHRVYCTQVGLNPLPFWVVTSPIEPLVWRLNTERTGTCIASESIPINQPLQEGA